MGTLRLTIGLFGFHLLLLCLLVSGSSNKAPKLHANALAWPIAADCDTSYSPACSSGITLSCEVELKGQGSLDRICTLNRSVELLDDSIISGLGSLEIISDASVTCPVPGCTIHILLAGGLILRDNASIVCGSLIIEAEDVNVAVGSSLNVSGLGGTPPAHSTGTPSGTDGAGAGHGGRGACCAQEDVNESDVLWGGDVYSWSSLSSPWSYGSKGGSTSSEQDLGGGGGGRINVTVVNCVELDGSILALGGSVGEEGGGGSGGSIFVQADSMKGSGRISVAGGAGRAGGGGGRVAIDCYRHEGVKVFIHGGQSLACPANAGAAGTRFDVVSQTLFVSNNNMSTYTDTLLLEFPSHPLWGNVFIECRSRAVIPLLWSRVQVRVAVTIADGSILSFGQSRYPNSEFEVVADEVLMNDATMKVYGALKLGVKMLLLWNSAIEIDGRGDVLVGTSTLEASNLAVLRDGSFIKSNANLAMHGQGLLKLCNEGDTITAQRVFLSLFYSIHIGTGAVLQTPVDTASAISDELEEIFCKSSMCPIEVISPSEDCTFNMSTPFTLQVCRVEDIMIDGTVLGSIVHVQRARTITVSFQGLISASASGCQGGVGKGGSSTTGAGGGGGHGGMGGSGYFNGTWTEGGLPYGDNDLPCELGSGGGNSSGGESTPGGGVVVLGSLDHSLSSLDVYGSITADGGSYIGDRNVTLGTGGGSGGSVLVFLQTLTLGNDSVVSSAGGQGGRIGGGGGAGGRVHFHWSNIATGEDFVPIANVKGLIHTRGGLGSDYGLSGEDGSISGRECPSGLHGVFCEECPTGTYKNESGSESFLCKECASDQLPHRAFYVYVRGGATSALCPYQCISDKYRMPYCYTPLEEVIYALGGPWLFTIFLAGTMVLLALVLSVARMKLIGNDDFSGPTPTPHGTHLDHSFPFLESLNEVLENNRVEESQSHIYRIFFLGCNSFTEPWHLPHSPPEQIKDLVYEDAFNRFVDELNRLAAYTWWEGSVYSILSLLAYPFAWSWQQWRRRKKVQRLREYVRSEYDHACLRSCRSRALYEGLKVAATPDLMLAYIDVFLGGDEKRPDLPPKLLQRLPMCVMFGGDGSYMAPYSLHSDNLLTSLLGQAMPATMWYRFVAGLNAQLRCVRKGCLRRNLLPVVQWLNSHANPWLCLQGVRADIAWFQAPSSTSFQLGIVLNGADETLHFPDMTGSITPRLNYGDSESETLLPSPQWSTSPNHTQLSASRRRVSGSIIHADSVNSLKDKKDTLFPLNLLLRNTQPAGHQALVGLVLLFLILADMSLTGLTFFQYLSVSLVAFLLFLLVLPFARWLSIAAGLNALFSFGRNAPGLSRVYALWNVTSMINALFALLYGFLYDKFGNVTVGGHKGLKALSFTAEDETWWLFPTLLLLCDIFQCWLIDLHISNLEIQDYSLYSDDPTKFWETG